MRNITHNLYCMVLSLLSTVLFSGPLMAQQDTLNIKMPKHYFKTVIHIDAYSSDTKNIPDTSNWYNNRLKTYGVKQTLLSLSMPLATFESVDRIENRTRNTHILLTANYHKFRPQFEGITQHELVKLGLGTRMIINPGKKGVWFIEVAPFATKDVSADSRGYLRLASTVVYSHNTRDWFNWRIGATKSFLWGNRNYLPFIGIRIGKLDDINLSIQFPRSINLNFPLSRNFHVNLYTKPQGGMYNFANNDTLYVTSKVNTFHMSRYELNTGVRFDFAAGTWFGGYVGLGVSSGNAVVFYADKPNNRNPAKPLRDYFYSQRMPVTGFLNIGLLFKIGKTRSYYNNTNMRDVIDLNNTIQPGDNASGGGNMDIHAGKEKERKKNINLESVQDLIDYNDF